MRWRSAIVPVLAFPLAGCFYLNDSKTLTVPPSDKPTTVTTRAMVKCIDYGLFEDCTLYLELTDDRGHKVTSFPQPSPPTKP